MHSGSLAGRATLVSGSMKLGNCSRCGMTAADQAPTSRRWLWSAPPSFVAKPKRLTRCDILLSGLPLPVTAMIGLTVRSSTISKRSRYEPAIAIQAITAQVAGVMMSRLFAMFIALSLMFGPLAMDRAMAAVPAANHSQMAAEGHCPPPADDLADKAMAKQCCAAMCATAAVLHRSHVIAPMFDRLAASTVPAKLHRDVLSKISTPPPRIS